MEINDGIRLLNFGTIVLMFAGIALACGYTTKGKEIVIMALGLIMIASFCTEVGFYRILDIGNNYDNLCCASISNGVVAGWILSLNLLLFGLSFYFGVRELRKNSGGVGK